MINESKVFPIIFKLILQVMLLQNISPCDKRSKLHQAGPEELNAIRQVAPDQQKAILRQFNLARSITIDDYEVDENGVRISD